MVAFSEGSYFFIDAGCFNAAMKDVSQRYFFDDSPRINWAAVRGYNRKAYYYDAIPTQIYGEDETDYNRRVEPKRQELATISHVTGFHVRTGLVKKGGARRGNEQKMVDVQLAVDALFKASRDLFSSCFILTSDLDFYPLISALVDLGIDVTLYYRPGHTNDDLISEADRALPLDPILLCSWMTHEYISGKEIPRDNLNFQESPPNDIGSALVRWHDQKYGDSYLIKRGDLFFIEIDDLGDRPGTRRQITSKDERILRLYIEDVYGLQVPCG